MKGARMGEEIVVNVEIDVQVLKEAFARAAREYNWSMAWLSADRNLRKAVDKIRMIFWLIRVEEEINNKALHVLRQQRDF